MSLIKCLYCSRTLPEDSAFFQYCGEKLDDSALQEIAIDADKKEEYQITTQHRKEKKFLKL